MIIPLFFFMVLKDFSNKLFYAVLLLCVGSIIVFFFRYQSLIKAFDTLDRKIDALVIVNNNLESDLLRSIRLEKTSFSFNELLISYKDDRPKGTQYDSILLKSLLGKSKLLIYKFSSSDCVECVRDQFQRLNRFMFDDKEYNVVIVMSFLNLREFRQYASSFKSEFLFFGEPSKFPVADHSFFVLDESGFPRKFFFPNSDNGELTDRYFITLLEN